MAVIIKKKNTEGSVQLIAPDTPTVNYTVLEDVGLVEEKELSLKSYKKGQRVKVILPPYPWTEIWKLNDVGTVVRTWPPTREFEKLGPGHGVVAVEMDIVRREGWETIYFCEKDLEVVP
jgi:hypothetical protein